jgi:hypothetical protein
LRKLEIAFDAGALRFFNNLANLAEPRAFARRLSELRRRDWVVYAKPPFGSPEQVLTYLGRYTHRVAMPTAGCSRSPTVRSASPGNTTDRTARPR